MNLDQRSDEISESPERKNTKISDKANEIKNKVPRRFLSKTIDDLRWYIAYRKLDQDAKNYPGDTDKFQIAQDKMLENYDLFLTLHDEYGWTPAEPNPKWTIEELEGLVNELEKKLLEEDIRENIKGKALETAEKSGIIEFKQKALDLVEKGRLEGAVYAMLAGLLGDPRYFPDKPKIVEEAQALWNDPTLNKEKVLRWINGYEV